MALKTAATMEAAMQFEMRDTASLSTGVSGQTYTLLNQALRMIWESKADWTIRLNPTQVGLNSIAGTTTTSGTYGNRIESIHGLYIEGGATAITSTNQLERLEVSEFLFYKQNGSDGAGADTTGPPLYYAAEPLAADTDTTATNHGLWRIHLAFTDATARHYSVKARLRYAELTGTTQVPDCPDSWCDVAITLAAIWGAQAIGKRQVAQDLIQTKLPQWAEQFVRRRGEITKPRVDASETVAR